jgi:hypothetical protein
MKKDTARKNSYSLCILESVPFAEIFFYRSSHFPYGLAAGIAATNPTAIGHDSSCRIHATPLALTFLIILNAPDRKDTDPGL